MSRAIVAVGLWCTECEFFENEGDFDGDRCMSCDCAKDIHQAVEVVTIDEVR